MPTIAVTGSTGGLGTAVIAELLKRVPASRIVAIARDSAKAEPLRVKGVEVRIADYSQPETLGPALAGVDSLLLISANEIGKRLEQHKAVIDAAKAAGVSYLVYTSLLRAPTSDLPLAGEHVASESYLAASGIPHTLLRNGWYHENYRGTLEQVRSSGVLLTSAGAGKVSSAARPEYAEAAAIVLTEAGHSGKAYELAGDVAWTQDELAADLAAVIGTPVTVKNISTQEHAAALEAAGLPAGAVSFVTAIDASTAGGGLEERGGDLSRLLGRPTVPLVEVLRGLA